MNSEHVTGNAIGVQHVTPTLSRVESQLQVWKFFVQRYLHADEGQMKKTINRLK